LSLEFLGRCFVRGYFPAIAPVVSTLPLEISTRTIYTSVTGFIRALILGNPCGEVSDATILAGKQVQVPIAFHDLE